MRGTAVVDFARSYRLVPLLLGLGLSTQMPHGYSVGLPGLDVLTLAGPLYEVWAHSPVHATLWDTCCWYAHARRTAGADEPYHIPQRVVEGVLANLHGLLSCTAAYVDSVS
jgi:hypothetical protein